MKRVNALLLMLLVILSFFLTPYNAFASISSSKQDENNFKNRSASEQKNMQTSASLSLFLWTDKDTYYREENVIATTRFLYEETPVPDASVTLEVSFPDGTLWFVWTNETNEEGIATFEFLLPLTNPSGEYTTYATAYKLGLGNASATTKFEVLNKAPEIHSVEIDPQIVEQPTTVLIQVNAADFEDGTNIQIKSIISIPNGTVQQLNMTFDGTFFTLNYPIQSTDPTGNYTVIVVARDTEDALASFDRLSFLNAIVVNRGTVLGIVTDKSVSPIFNATLTLRRVDGYLVYRNFTDINGKYIFNKVLPGSYVLEASAKDFASNSTAIEVVSNETKTVDFTLLHLPIIYGYVKTKVDTPISDALITVSSIRGIVGSSYTNESGFYRVIVSNEGMFTIRASAYGYAPNSSIITVYLESVTQMNFTLEENGIVKGKVKDSVSGLPIPNATVYLGKQTYLGTRNFTDQYGNFSLFDVSPGDYVVRATARGYLSNSSSIAVAAGATTFVELELIPTGNITGTVRDSDTGTPISGAKVALINEIGWILVVYVTDVNGIYLFERVKPGNYALKTYAYGYNSTTVSVEVKPYETSVVNFDLVSNKIFLDLHIPSAIYSRGETIQFTINVTNPLGESVAENITSIQLVLMGPSNETISITVSKVNDSFSGNHTIPSDAGIGTWAVIVKVTDIHGNVGDDIKFIGIGEAFYIQFTTDRKSYISAENVTFYAIIAKYSNLSRFLNEQDVNVTVHIYDQSNTTLAQVLMTTVNNVFSGTYPLTGFDVGNYTAFLTVDDGQGNVMTHRTLFKVVHDFSVLVYTNKLIYNRTETVKISGSATYETGDPVANTTVKVRLEVKGYARTFFTTTDNNGDFEYSFIPAGFDSGNYTLESSIIAYDIERKANSTFVILGLVLNPFKLNVKMSMNSANNISISIGNIGETTLTGINVSITSSVNGVNATIVVPPASSLAPGQWTSFTVRIASGVNTSETTSFNLVVSTDQGAFEYGMININLYPATPVALVSPQIIDLSLTADSFSVHQINVTNIGYGSMNNVHITEPNLSWIFITLTDLGNINSKESKVFDVVIVPTNVSIGVYEDQITILSDNHQAVNIYLIITITSIERGSLLFHVFDELGNHVLDAQVMVQYQEYYLDTLSGATNAAGQLLFDNLSAGRYSYFVSKEGHDSASGVAVVYPGKSVTVEVLLPLRIMDVSFKVEPITIQDQYIITLNLTFQAEIPPPVLLPIPSVLQYWADRAYVFDNGYSATGEVSIVNTGLISVSDIILYVEYSSSASGYHISFLDLGEIIGIDTIEAKDSARIPLTLNIDPGVLITELPFGLIGKIKIQGTFIYFDPGSDIPRTAVTKSEVLIYIFETGARQLCVNPWAIYGIEQEGIVSFTLGSWPDRLPDVTITNCADIEKVNVYTIAVGGGITIFVGIDPTQILIKILTGQWAPIDIGAFLVFGLITRYGGLPGEEIPLVDAEDTFGLVEVGLEGGPLYSLLVQALVRQALGEGVIGQLELLPSESAILQSEMWDLPFKNGSKLSWAELFREIIGFKIRLGLGVTVGGIVFSYQWEHDTGIIPSFYLVPIFILSVFAPTISIPLPSGPGGIGGLIGSGGIGYGEYVFNPPSVTYEDRPIVRRVQSIPIPKIHETLRLSISQQATLERDAFLATLTMKNRLTNTPIENVNVTLKITNQNGTDATDNFFIKTPNLENINAIDGTGIIEPNATVAVQWTIIPKPGAGGANEAGMFYFIQAFITYTVNGTKFSVNSTRETINVKPQPLLVLDYYIPSEVRANVPFKLAVKVTNIGNGTARNFAIESAQPVIYDNISGLLISFRIIGSAIKGEPAGNSLKINFGDIPPGTSVIAYWIMLSSLDGVFLDFTASFIHTNELGGAETSLIHSVNASILMRDVMTDDVTFLFLIDTDEDGTPNELIDPIFADATAVIDVDYTVAFETGDPAMIIETRKYEGSWIWVDVDDPYNNQRPILQIIRSDGKILNPLNYWMANGKIYFVDDPEESYTIVYEIYDVSITEVSLSSNVVTQGETLTISVGILYYTTNETMTTETFDVTTYANETLLETKSATLTNGTTTTITFIWNTTGFPEGNYTIIANISSMLGEIDISNNTYINGIVEVITPTVPFVIIDQVAVSAQRVDIGSIQLVSFHAKWSNGSDVKIGEIYVNGTAFELNQTGWINIQVSFDTVGNRTWTVTGVSCEDVTRFNVQIPDPWIVWDHIQITLTPLDSRIDVNTNATITWTGTYEYDSIVFYGSITLDDTTVKTVVGKYCYTVRSVLDPKYKLTAFESNTICIVFDKVSIKLAIEDVRINVGTNASIVWTGFYEYDRAEFGGIVTLNDTNLIKTSVGKYGFTIQSITDPTYGLTAFITNEVYCIWDRVIITLMISDNRIDVGSSADILWTGFYEYNEETFSGTINFNDTLTKNLVGKYGYTVASIVDFRHGLTVFQSNSVQCIFDQISIQITISDNRISVGDTAPLNWTGIYKYDDTIFTGTITYNDTLTKNVVGKYGYTVSSVSDPLYGLTAFSANSVYCIFDKVSITISVADDRIDVGTQAMISWSGIYQFDNYTFRGDVIFNNTQTTYYTVEKRGYTVTSIYDQLYNITSFESNAVACVWDRVKVFEGGVSRLITNITQSETIWFKALYEYDNTTFDSNKGVLFVNGSAMIWSEANSRWEHIYSFSTVGNRTFILSGLLDSQYGLTTIDDSVGPLSITWVKYVVYIPTPEQISMANPLVLNATQIVNATIIIGNISAPTIIQVSNVSMPAPPLEGLKPVGKPVGVNVTRRVTGHFRIRIYYSDEQLEAEGIDEKSLKIYLWNGTHWIPVVTSHVNPAKNYVEGVITGFSIFLLMGSPITRSPPFQLVWLSIIVVIAIVSICLILLSKRRKPKKPPYNIPHKKPSLHKII